MLLAIDTATRTASLALYDEVNGWILGEETWYSIDNHSVELMPRLTGLVAQQGLGPGDLTGVVVSQGPGSFTGLRSGLSLAKGLALARSLPLVGVPTLDVTVRPHLRQRLPIWAILQAGRGRICAAYYEGRGGRWRRQGPYVITTVEGLCDQVKGVALVCGEIGLREAQLLRDRLGEGIVVVSPAASLRRATSLAEIGWERLARDDHDDPSTLQAIYLHHPPIDG